MWKSLHSKNGKNLGVRIMLGLVVGMLGVGMLLYLVPGQGGTDVAAADIVAQVGDLNVTVNDVRQQLGRVERNGSISPQLEPLYAQQILNQLVFEKELELEAKQLGIVITDQERADRIRQLIPTVFLGGSFVGMDQYAAQVQQQAGMDVPQFEDLISQSLVEEKFREMVTDGITVSPAEIDQEFRRRNEKVKISYVVIRPEDLAPKIEASDADLSAYFEKNKSRYTVPERRTVRYAFLSFDQLRARVNIADDELHAAYNAHLDRYKIDDRAHVAHILFKTVGKTDAENEEIRKKAEDVLKKAKSGANFGDLAKQFSEDTSKDKGGDLGWIVRGQTVPEFEQAAFSLPVGAISDLVKTQYGYHIIKVIERQTARTQTFDEVRPEILASLQQEKAEQMADDASEQIAEDIRRSGNVPITDLAKKYNMNLGVTPPLEAGQAIPEVGEAPGLSETIFQLRPGEVSAPARTDHGYVVFSVDNVQASHPAALAEVHDKVLEDYRHEKAVDLAKSRAEELAKRAKGGEDLAKVATSLGLQAKTSDLFSRTGSIPDVGGAAQLPTAFSLSQGQTADPVFLGSNWVVYAVADHQQPNPGDLPSQQADILQKLLDQKREMAFDAFRSALEERLKQEGKLRYNTENMKRLTSSPNS